MRSKYQVNLEVLLGEEKVVNLVAGVIDSQQDHVNAGRLTVAPGDTESIPFGGVATSKLVLIRSDQPVTLVFDGGAEEFALTPSATGDAGTLLWESDLQSIQVANPGSDDAAVVYAIVG